LRLSVPAEQRDRDRVETTVEVAEPREFLEIIIEENLPDIVPIGDLEMPSDPAIESERPVVGAGECEVVSEIVGMKREVVRLVEGPSDAGIDRAAAVEPELAAQSRRFAHHESEAEPINRSDDNRQ